MNSEMIIKTIKAITKTIREHAEELTELDRKIGDGDHGINLKRGFDAIDENLSNLKDKTPKEIFQACAMTLMTKVGGSSGPLLATAFLEFAKHSDNFAQAILAANNGIKMRGKATFGEKTMIDVLEPFALKYNEEINKGVDTKTAMELALFEAKKHLDNSKNIVATKGRASYLGQRSVGTTDPGSQSMYYILETIYEVNK